MQSRARHKDSMRGSMHARIFRGTDWVANIALVGYALLEEGK